MGAGRAVAGSGRPSVTPAWLALAACLLSACSFNPPLDLAATFPGYSPLLLASVPFYPQREYQCGPAALAGVLGAAGVATSPTALAPQVYLPGRQGSLQQELLAATRRAGRVPYLIPADPGALFAQLLSGHPVLVLQNLRTRLFPVWHYAVLVGFDPGANAVQLNSGTEQGLVMAAPAFLRTWDWAGRWAFVALRPGELPAQAQPLAFIEAVAAFEQVAGNAAAAPAWRSALCRWPAEPAPYLALGNLAYASGSLPLAVDYYRRGLEASPGYPALGNNLASVLGELGCPRTAAALLEPIQAGLAAGSNWDPVIAATLAELAPQAQHGDARCAALFPG